MIRRSNIAPLFKFGLACFGPQPLRFSVFILLATVAALTEGVGVSMLAPLLDSSNNNSTFTAMPIIGNVAALFHNISDPSQRILTIAAVMAGAFLARGLTQFGAAALGVTMPLRILDHASAASYRAVLAADFHFLARRDRGELVSMVVAYPLRAALAMADLATLLSQSLIFVVFGVLMVVVSWQLTLGACLFILFISMGLRRLIGGVVHRAGRRLSHAQADVQTLVMETLNGMRFIRLARGGARMVEQFSAELSRMVSAQFRAALFGEVSGPFSTTSAGLFICVLLAAGAMLHHANDAAWIGPLLLFLFLLFRLLTPVTNINTYRTRILANVDAIERLEEFQNEALASRQQDGTVPVRHLADRIAFEDVSYRYSDDTRPAVENLSFEIRRGEMIAIVGPSGAGKTTVVGLLGRLFDPTGGRISIDGVDLRDLAVDDWRSLIGVVSQDVFVFNDTVSRNLCFPSVGAPQKAIEDAVEMAMATSFVAELPMGYETPLGDHGTRLSGGQRQRLAIARTILSNPEVLILDEATSHLDSISETAIQRAIDSLSQRMTMVVIAHRLSTVRRANRIIVIDKGHVVEQGHHADLVRAKGRYWELLSNQAMGLTEDG